MQSSLLWCYSNRKIIEVTDDVVELVTDRIKTVSDQLRTSNFENLLPVDLIEIKGVPPREVALRARTVFTPLALLGRRALWEE